MTEEHVKGLLAEAVRKYRENTGTELTDEEIIAWVEKWLWVEDFMKKYEKSFGKSKTDRRMPLGLN